MDSKILIAKVLAGDSAAFEALSNQYYTKIKSAIRYYAGVSDHAMQDDLAQETLLIVRKNLAKFEYRSEGEFRGWFCLIARRVVLAYKRKASTRRERTVHDEGTTSVLENKDSREPRPDESLEIKERNDELLRAIQSLPDPQREVVLMKYYHDMNFLEIGEALDITAQAVRYHHELAIKRLRTRLQASLSLP